MRRLSGCTSLATAVVSLAFLVFTGWNVAWLVVLVLALAFGLYLLATGGARAWARG